MKDILESAGYGVQDIAYYIEMYGNGMFSDSIALGEFDYEMEVRSGELDG